MNWSPIILSLELALVTTILLFVVSVPLANWLAETKSRIKPIIESIISLPLVLPPTVLGFYLLVAFSPNNTFGNWLQETIGIQLLFSFPGLVLASMIYSLPFMVQPIQSGLASLSLNMKESSYVLGQSKFKTLTHVLLPNIKPSILTALVLSFAHTMGEFGVVLMIGGNIPGVTKVASIAIYDEVESLNYAAAHQYALVLLLLSFGILVTVYSLNKRINLTGNHA
ncbi:MULTISPECIES: molybdate ABC transporter permease subunit [Roseivirga]|uniref:Molybdenum transport system permease n=1 Tax=Roseivirga spongicola TaxID=333140 RepID=A0A150X4B8_9BACT|nr:MULTISPECIES: molybdate ABC transporter permease subunit [Roseivirga]KYG73554.1 molybdenum ABC transporter permease [Roseivirga spongicola]MBO6659822.1 molybdate ABC transporter permease subunit [Roseivirga sp.]MBO6907441.1 molybdate ABC transporter permease subunit [Roseivirga sp.]WPZ09816.1 molybdate ABC transporter permease subunit [Roseivirga spongicola]